MKKVKNYQPWLRLNDNQKKQVKEFMLSQKCEYYSKMRMQYNIDENGNFTREYIDPYFFSSEMYGFGV